MALIDTLGPHGILIRMDMQQNARHLAPVSSVLGSVEQHIGDGMFPVISRQLRLGRS
jgi:hypothetical protein